MPLAYPMWLWWTTGSDSDRAFLRELEQTGGYDWTELHFAHDKEEQGHEAAWLSYLAGQLPDYPEQALGLALGQVARRVGLIKADTARPGR